MFTWLSSVLVRWLVGVIIALAIALGLSAWQLKRAWQEVSVVAANCTVDQLQETVNRQLVALGELEQAKKDSEVRAEILEGVIRQLSVKNHADKEAIAAERDFWIRKARNAATSSDDCAVIANLGISCLYDYESR